MTGTSQVLAGGPADIAASVVRQLDFAAWLADEVRSRPDEEQLKRVQGKSHLDEVRKVPLHLEKLLGFGFMLCLDILLHELSFTPLQVAKALWRLLLPSAGRRPAKQPRFTITEQGDLLRLTLLLLNVGLVSICFDDSKLYHDIRRESFLKLYVVFNMLEMFERWLRSVGVDLCDWLAASARSDWQQLLPRYTATLICCFFHSTMHLLRVLLLNVAINTSSNAVFLIIVTNNFGEIKSTVFKKYDKDESLFPIITSDIVERFYLVADIIFVLARLSISPRRGAYSGSDIGKWLFLLVVIEVGTDWVKFCLIFKFSDLNASRLQVYKEVLIADILLCRSGHSCDAGLGPGAPKDALSRPEVPFRGVHSFSHTLARRLGFCGLPISTLVVVQGLVLLRSPCSPSLGLQRVGYPALFLSTALMLALLLKVFLGLGLLGYAARRRKKIKEGLKLFKKIKAL